MTRSVFESRRGPLEIPTDKPERPELKLERLPPRRKPSRLERGLEIAFAVLLCLFALGWIAQRL